MNRTLRVSAASALLAATMAMPIAAWAQTQEGPSTAAPMPGQAPAAMSATPHAAMPGGRTPQAAGLMQGVEQHIRDLHRQLKITAAEEPQWQQFAAVMRGNAQAMASSLDDRAQKISSMTAVDDMTSYAQLAEQRSQDLVKLAAAFQTLYGSFPDQQKKDADMLFRQKSEAHAEKGGARHAS